MAKGIIFVALLLITLVNSLKEDVQNTDYEYDDDYYDDPEIISDSEEIEETDDITSVPKSLQTDIPKVLKVHRDREELTTEKQVATYEVTELVIDVPDVNAKRVPIITNFSLTRPLNFAGTPNNKKPDVEANVPDIGDENINSILTPNKPKVSNKSYENKDESDYFSNSSPKDSFEEEFDKEFGSDGDEFDSFEDKEEPKPSKGFKDHFHNFRKNIANGFKSVVDKHKDGIPDSLRSFFSKLHRKSSDLVNKFQNTFTRHKLHDHDGHGHRDD